MMHFSLVPYKIAMAALRLSDSKVFHSTLYKKEKKKKKDFTELSFKPKYCIA